MNQDDKELMMQVFSSVFENFAFMFVEDEADLETAGPGPCFKADIRFKSEAAEGVMEIAAPVAFCNELAENILGAEDGQLPEDAGENALKEVLNVSCGYLLAEKFGTEVVFDLSIPQTNEISEKQWSDLLEGGSYNVFSVEESPMLARVALQP